MKWIKRIFLDIYFLLGVLLISVFFACIWLTKYQMLPPALQSVWFIPHVAAYMIGYVIITFVFMLAFVEFIFSKDTNKVLKIRRLLDVLVRLGTVTLGFGMCFGALWAKKAWGQYWAWDIKETAALITLTIFLLYIHLQNIKKISRKILLLIVMVGFLSILFTWYGVKYFPTAQKSPHTFYNDR